MIIIWSRLTLIFTCLFSIYVFFIPQSEASTTEEKMKALEKMFDSPYTEEMYYRTDRLLLTATGSLQPLYKAPAVATVITAEDIERIGARDLDEVLETVPGLHVSPSHLNRLNSIYSIRGIHTNNNPQVLLLMNGLPVTQLFNGSRPPTFRLPVTNISRIEVIRGPGSAIYGADAFAGTINVITKDSHDIDGTKVGVRAGSFGYHESWLQHGNTWQGWDVALSIDYQKSDGDNDRIVQSDSQTSLDAFPFPPLGPNNASYAPAPLETDFKILDAHLGLNRKNWTIRLWGWVQDDAGMGGGGALALDPAGRQDVEQFLADLTYRKADLIPDLEASINLNYFYIHDDSFFVLFPPGTKLPIGPDGNIGIAFDPEGNPVDPIVAFPNGFIGNPIARDHHGSVELTTLYSGFDQHRLRFSLGGKLLKENTEHFSNFGPTVIDGTDSVVDGTLTDLSNTDFKYMPDQSRDLWFISLQDEWSFSHNWEITAGIRYDEYSDFGHTVNPRVALVWEPRFDLTTKLLYGEAFRAPSFSEQFAVNNPSILGNANLDPEKIRTLELAFDYQPTHRLRTILNLFGYKVDDLIEFVQETIDQDTGRTIARAQNSKDIEGYGFEIEVEWQITDAFNLYGNLAYQKSKDEETDEIVPDAPALQIYLNPHWNFYPNWSVDCQFFWIGDRERATSDTRADIENYNLVNLTLRRKNIFQHWGATVSIRNVFDEDIREPSLPSVPNDISMEGRGVFGEINYSF